MSKQFSNKVNTLNGLVAWRVCAVSNDEDFEADFILK